MIFYVTVAVALARPPTVDEWRRYAVEAKTPFGAQVIAQQMASCTSVMPIYAEVTGDEEFPDYG